MASARAAVALALLLALPAAAEEPARRMLGAEEAVPYRGVGRLNVAGTRFCTATLISETVIVTAAHCLYHPRTKARVPLSELRFVAGLRLGEKAAVRRVARAAADPDFVYTGDASLTGVAADLAVLELAEPVPAEVAPAFPTADLDPEGAGPAIVSYARDRAQAPSIEAPCAVVAATERLVALGCLVNYGASGAPVLQDGRLVAVVSAMGESGGQPVALAARAGAAIPPLLAALPEAEAVPPRQE